MLIGEYDYATDIAVQREEAGKLAFANGMKQGLAEGEARGRSEGSRQTKLETANTMLTMGYPLADICKITGLSKAEIEMIK